MTVELEPEEIKAIIDALDGMRHMYGMQRLGTDNTDAKKRWLDRECFWDSMCFRMKVKLLNKEPNEILPF